MTSPSVALWCVTPSPALVAASPPRSGSASPGPTHPARIKRADAEHSPDFGQRRRGGSGGRRRGGQAISHEQEGKEVLARLDKADADDPEFEGLLSEFIGAGRDHISFEETQVWPGLRARLIAAEADEFGGKIEKAKKRAPTRPHPHTLPAPGMSS
jgi:hypothetical protein